MYILSAWALVTRALRSRQGQLSLAALLQRAVTRELALITANRALIPHCPVFNTPTTQKVLSQEA